MELFKCVLSAKPLRKASILEQISICMYYLFIGNKVYKTAFEKKNIFYMCKKDKILFFFQYIDIEIQGYFPLAVRNCLINRKNVEHFF